jgi:hypothetical protein
MTNIESLICSKMMHTQNLSSIKHIIVHLSASKDEDIVVKNWQGLLQIQAKRFDYITIF